MKNIYLHLPVYTGDISGALSALYHSNGLLVIHDSSGCNSTYNTHDEIRWYDHPSTLFISGLKESDAIKGNDQKLIDDILEASQAFPCKYIALLNSPIPYIIGTDFSYITSIIEEKTNIPCFYIPTNAMNSYEKGISESYLAFAKKFLKPKQPFSNHINILGYTPLDFDYMDSINSLKELFKDYTIQSIWGESSFDEMCDSTHAEVNIVLNIGSLALAKYFEKHFHIPYIIGFPNSYTIHNYLLKMKKVIETKQSINLIYDHPYSSSISIIGDPVISASIGYALNKPFQIISPFPSSLKIMHPNDKQIQDEEEIEKIINQSSLVIGDPCFQSICSKPYFPIRHLALSGRLHKKDSYNLFKGELYEKLTKI